MHDEYTEQEQDDAVEIVAWLAEQPWLHRRRGHVRHLLGRLQLAPGPRRGARPPSRRSSRRARPTIATPTTCTTLAAVCSTTTPTGARPSSPSCPSRRDPEIMGEGWRENWRERLESAPCPVETWLRHQCRDDYWKHASVNEDYGAIKCPVFAVGGWLDGYTNAIPRLLANLDVPRLGLIGPHAHQFGHSERAPGPAIGFLQESLRLVGPLAQGTRHRNHGRSDVARVHGRGHPGRGALRAVPGTLGGGSALAEPADRDPDLSPQPCGTRRRGRGGGGSRALLAPERRTRCGGVVSLRNRRRRRGVPPETSASTMPAPSCSTGRCSMRRSRSSERPRPRSC